MRRPRQPLGPRARIAGFTLLEAIVALTLIASTGLALMAWINSSLSAASRLQERDAEAALKLAAVQALQTVNPVTRPEGELELGSLRLRWQSAPKGPPSTSAGLAGPGAFRVQLFDAKVIARDASTAAEVEFSATLLGFQYTGAGRAQF